MDSVVRILGIGDRRTRHVATLLALLIFLSMADLYFTIWAHRFTPFIELNPMARELLAQRNVAGLIAMKLAFTLVGVSIFWALRRRGSVEAAVWMLFILHVMLVVRWSHYVSAATHAPDRDGNNCYLQVAGL